MKRIIVILGGLALSLFGAGTALGHTVTSVDAKVYCDNSWSVAVNYINFSDGHSIVIIVNGVTYPEIYPAESDNGTYPAHTDGVVSIAGSPASDPSGTISGTVSTPDDPQNADLTFSAGPATDCPSPTPTSTVTQHSAPPSPTPSHHLTPTPKPDATPPPTSTDSLAQPVPAFGWLAWFSLTVAFSLTVYAIWRIADRFGAP